MTREELNLNSNQDLQGVMEPLGDAKSLNGEFYFSAELLKALDKMCEIFPQDLFMTVV